MGKQGTFTSIFISSTNVLASTKVPVLSIDTSAGKIVVTASRPGVHRKSVRSTIGRLQHAWPSGGVRLQRFRLQVTEGIGRSVTTTRVAL